MADDHERLADKIELSYEEAVALKEEMRRREESVGAQWGCPTEGAGAKLVASELYGWGGLWSDRPLFLAHDRFTFWSL
jgi:hypothetical protein